jgi:hypothetical protein
MQIYLPRQIMGMPISIMPMVDYMFMPPVGRLMGTVRYFVVRKVRKVQPVYKVKPDKLVQLALQVLLAP